MKVERKGRQLAVEPGDRAILQEGTKVEWGKLRTSSKKAKTVKKCLVPE